MLLFLALDTSGVSTEYKGIYKIGQKAANRVNYVQVTDGRGSFLPMDVNQYRKDGIQPDLQSLPWREDWLRQSRENSNC
jgi:hypothetical protein